jgi:voltage-dependent potassium channel beta subunit
MGQTGLLLSEVGLGTWATVGDRLDEAASKDLIATAYDLGITHFDLAEVYANGLAESTFGSILSRLRWNRETYVISTKLMWGTQDQRPNTWGLGRKHLIEGCNASLKRLRLDYVDLLLCHRADSETPLEETVETMGDLVRTGKVLYWGTSEWPANLIEQARDIARRAGSPMPVVDQSRYNLLERSRVETELADLAGDGLAICGWSPIAYGVLAGRSTVPGADDGRFGRSDMDWLRENLLGGDDRQVRLAISQELLLLASELGTTGAVLALAWAIASPLLSSVITGASSAEQLQENMSGLDRLGDLGSVRNLIDSRLQDRGLHLEPIPEPAPVQSRRQQ